MTRTATEIRQRITELETELQRERAAYADASRRESLNAKARAVYDKMMDGFYPIVGAAGRLWWVKDGELLGHLDSDELIGLHELERRGDVVMDSKRAA